MNMKRIAILFTVAAIAWCAVLTAACGIAEAKIGLAVGGIGPRLPHPGTVKVGPVTYTPGDAATEAAASSAENAPTELSQFVAGLKHKSQCARLHALYVSRHGATTPRPLKGESGCAKYARDNAYWQSRRGERQSLTSPANAVFYAAHNIVLPW